nr:DUF2970 domain-containing protein [Neptuniibacter halophilus]
MQQSSKPAWWQVLCSVLAAFFGVQSQRNQARDFAGGRFWPYVVTGILLTLVFVAVVYLLVRLALVYATG